MTNDYEHKMLKSINALEKSMDRLTKALYEQNKILEKLVPDEDMKNEEADND